MSTDQTRAVVSKYFTDLAEGNFAEAMAVLSPDIDFELPLDQFNKVIPYLGHHTGIDAVQKAFGIRGETTEVLDYALREVRADGEAAIAIIYTKAAHTRTRQEFVIEDAHRLVVSPEGKITHWKAYFDPNGEIAAFNADREQRFVAAVRAGDTALAGELLGFGADVDQRTATGLTPLMIAAGQADVAMTELLIGAGADVFTVDSGAGATALHKACQGGSLDVVQALVRAGAFVDQAAAATGHTPLMDALWFAYPDIAKYLLDHGAGLNLSTHYGFSLKEHFDYELRVNTTSRDRLLLAQQYLNERLAADDLAIANQHLMAAVTSDDVEAARTLIAGGAEVDAKWPLVNGFNDGHTPLLVASRDGHTEIAKLLLEAGADVNATEPTFGAVPLHKAVYNGHVELTTMVANWPGVNLDWQGATNGYSPLHDAIWHGYAECAEAVFDAGARVDLVGHDGRTPLDLATEVLGAEHQLTTKIARRATESRS